VVVLRVVIGMSERFKFTVGGVEFSLSKEEVERRLQTVEPESIREVSVEVGAKRYPVKQALAEAAGLLRGNFTSHDAMRVFRKLALPLGTGQTDVSTLPDRYYTMLKSLNEFDKQEVRGVVAGLLAATDRDKCFVGLYYRGKANIESLLSLKNVKDVQAIAMVARCLFELAVDIKLIDVIPDAVQKIVAFSDVERLRAARKIVKFKIANPTASVNSSVHALFVTNNASRIDAERNALWPGVKKVDHWSGLRLSERAALLKAPFEEVYELKFPQLSWYTHSAGLTGFVNLEASTFNLLSASQFELAGKFYILLLTAVIDEFGLGKADARIKDKLKLAQVLPFTDTDDQVEALRSELLG
jgi:hypothetical protein